jgi:hypothetical protein
MAGSPGLEGAMNSNTSPVVAIHYFWPQPDHEPEPPMTIDESLIERVERLLAKYAPDPRAIRWDLIRKTDSQLEAMAAAADERLRICADIRRACAAEKQGGVR